MDEDVSDPGSKTYSVKARAPAELTKEELVACAVIIKKGEAVDLHSAEKELPQAGVVVVARKGRRIVGVGAIKRVRRAYAASISQNSGATFPTETRELGYVAVDPDHQGHGLSHRILATLLSEYDGRLFATTSNDRMKRTLSEAGFVKKGKEWKGRTAHLSFWEK